MSLLLARLGGPATITGSGAGTIAWTSAGAAVAGRVGSGAGTIVWTGAGAGVTGRIASGAGLLAWTGAGAGTVTPAGVLITGDGGGILAWTGTGAGAVQGTARKRRGVSSRIRKALEDAATLAPPPAPDVVDMGAELVVPVAPEPVEVVEAVPPAPPLPLAPATPDALEVVPWSPERDAALRQPYTPDAPALLGPNTWTTLDEDEMLAVLLVLTPGALAPVP